MADDKARNSPPGRTTAAPRVVQPCLLSLANMSIPTSSIDAARSVTSPRGRRPVGIRIWEMGRLRTVGDIG